MHPVYRVNRGRAAAEAHGLLYLFEKIRAPIDSQLHQLCHLWAFKQICALLRAPLTKCLYRPPYHLPCAIHIQAGCLRARRTAGAKAQFKKKIQHFFLRERKADDLMPSVGKDYRLRKALGAVSDRYDFAILDTPPALDTLTVNALTAASWVVIPAQADAYSLDGVTDLAATIQAIREYTNPDLKIAGILLMRYNPRTPISKIIREDAEAMAAELDTKVFRAWIREATVIKESQAVKQSLFAYAPSAKVAYDYRFFIEELLEDING